MTENIPSVPQAPHPQSQPPYQGPAPQPQLPYQAQATGPGYQAPYPNPQPYPPAPAYGQAPYQQYPQQYAPAGYPGPARRASSGLRIAAGIVGIVLGAWTVLPSIVGISGASGPFISVLLLLSALATITAGIMVLVTQRARSRWAAVTLLSTAGAIVLLGFMGAWKGDYGIGVFVTILPLAVPVGILLGLVLAKEKRPAI